MAALGRFAGACSCCRLVGLGHVPGQVDLEGRALARLAVDVDEAVVLLDDAVDRGQPQAGAFAHLLGGEKRLEDVVQGLLVHAAAVVAHRQQHILAGDKPGMVGAVGFVEGRRCPFRW